MAAPNYIRSRLLAIFIFACTVAQITAFVSPNARITNSISSKTIFPPTSTTSLGMWSGDDELQGSDRIKACIPYILPILDGDEFGRYIYQRIPPLGVLDDILLGPLENIYHGVPFLSLVLFIALTLGTRGNTNISRGVRFNAQQAALIDVALIFPELIASSVEGQPIPRYIAEPSSNFVYYTFIAMVGYSIWSNLNGQKPNQIPWISNNAEMMTGPM